MSPLHDDELAVDVDLVRRLVARSFPQLAGLEVRPLPASGSSNALFRLGEELLVRLPRQPGGSATIEKEARWSPVVAAGLTVPVPEIVAVGDAGLGYPERWALTRWLDGRTPDVPWDAARGPSYALALDLARTVRELRGIDVPAPALEDPRLRWYRGGALADLDDDFRAALRASAELRGLDLDLRRAVDVWERALEAGPGVALPARWYHGDLLAENLLVRDGRLAAVLDLGGPSVGDPTVDLAVAWEVLDADGREAFRRALDVDEATWARAAGWALLIAMITFPYYWESLPSRCAARRSMAAAVLERGAAERLRRAKRGYGAPPGPTMAVPSSPPPAGPDAAQRRADRAALLAEGHPGHGGDELHDAPSAAGPDGVRRGGGQHRRAQHRPGRHRPVAARDRGGGLPRDLRALPPELRRCDRARAQIGIPREPHPLCPPAGPNHAPGPHHKPLRAATRREAADGPVSKSTQPPAG